MLKRLRQIARLSKYDDPILERIDALAAAIEENKKLSSNGSLFDLSDLQDRAASRLLATVERVAGKPDGEFLPDMSEQEVLEYERTERLGWKNFKLPWQK